MKQALVTGAGGFLGGHLARHLCEKGFEVWASYHRRRQKLPFRVRWIRADLTHPQETLNLVRRSRPDFVFHLAAQAVPSASWKDPNYTLRMNVAGSLSLFEAVLRHAPRARVVVVSSAQVYGRTLSVRNRVSEQATPDPLNPYAGSKLLMELAALNFCRTHNLDVVIVRPFNQVGTGQSPQFVFADFCRQIALIETKRQPPVLKVGNMDVVRDFVHVRDTARGLLLLARRGRSGEIYNLGSGRGVRLRKGIGFLARQSKVRFKVKEISARLRKDDLTCALVDCTKLRRLGWRPKESIWEGLREVLEEWRRKV